jgi:hypothetical protein
MDGIFEMEDGRTCIALFYYSEKRGGGHLAGMKRYMESILHVCGKQMNFHPCGKVVCLYDGIVGPVKSYSYAV